MKYTISIVGVLLTLSFQIQADEGFLADSKSNFIARNYFFDRNFKGDSTVGAARDWTQGFILRSESGYTKSTFGFGLDAAVLSAVNLLGANPEYAPTGLTPVNMANNKRPSTFSELQLTAKAKYNNLTLHIGTLTPMYPVLFASPTRLFQQTYQGIQLQSTDVDALTLTGIYVNRVNHRDSTDNQKIQIANINGRFDKPAESSGLHMFGLNYKLTSNITTQLFHANLHEVYKQNLIAVKASLPTVLGQVNTETKLFLSKDSGDSLAGNIDNRQFLTSVGLKQKQHLFTVGYMQSFGDTAMPVLSGTEAPGFYDSYSADFINPDEKALQFKYEYNFDNTILKGLLFTTRYTKGVDIKLPKISNDDFAEEAWDVDFNYRISLKKDQDLNLRTRYTHYRNDISSSNITFKPADETRFNLDYSWKF